MPHSDGPAGLPPVVVTGLGVVTAAGWGLDAFAAALGAGHAALGGFSRFDHAQHRTHVAGEVPEAPASSPRATAPCRRSNMRSAVVP